MRLRDLWLIVRRNLARRPFRTGLTVLGVTLAITLYLGVEAFSAGMDRVIDDGDHARTLVVYRKNRYCPQTSFLPERYEQEIASIDGVESILPVKVFLNNCRTNLDMVTFQGAPPDALLASRNLQLVEGDMKRFTREPDAALVGRGFAARRGLSAGDTFRFGDITVKVAAIVSSPDPLQENLVLTHLQFLQRAGPVNRLGTVTQFDVRIDDPKRAQSIAAEIDRRLSTAEEPTATRPMSAFLERATRDLREIIRFGRFFGATCVLVVLVLVGNTIYLSIHDRRRELGVFSTIGFRARQLVPMVLAESMALAFAGGFLGLILTWAVIRWTAIGIGVEGIQVSFVMTSAVIFEGLVLIFICALVAGALPALRVARRGALESLRSVG